MSTSSMLILVPWLHRSFVAPTLPTLDGEGSVQTLWPGLPDPPKEDAIFCPQFPYTPAEARACLSDWQAFVQERSAVAEKARHESLHEQFSQQYMNEDALLQDFVRTGTYSSPKHDAGTQEQEMLRAAQRRLLMIWMQEEEVVGIQKLLARYQEGTHNLAESLHDHSLEEGELTAEKMPTVADKSLVFDDAQALLPPWSFALINMLPFIPVDAVLYVADERMRDAIMQLDVTLQPLIPATKTTPLVRQVELPLWALLGLRENEAKPWCQTRTLRVVEAL